MNRREAIGNLGLGLGGSLLAGTTGVMLPENALGQEIEQTARFGSLGNEALELKERNLISKDTKVILESLKPNQKFIDNISLLGKDDDSKSSTLYLESAEKLIDKDLDKQFIAYQLERNDQQFLAKLPTRVSPTLSAPESTPDVLLSTKLVAFHLAENLNVNSDSRATLKLTFGGGNQTPRARDFDPVLWAIVTGLTLYDQQGDRSISRNEGNRYESNLSANAFSKRPIEIPGGSGELRFEVFKHKEPRWWESALDWFTSDAGRLLTQSIGFPGVAQIGLDIVDDFFSKWEGRVEKLLVSIPLKFTLTSEAHDIVAGDYNKVSSLNKGLWILASRSAIDDLHEKEISVYPNLGLIAPAGLSDEVVYRGGYDDPFKNLTYAILQTQMKATKLEKSLL